jgi:hypothetical protein
LILQLLVKEALRVGVVHDAVIELINSAVHGGKMYFQAVHFAAFQWLVLE